MARISSPCCSLCPRIPSGFHFILLGSVRLRLILRAGLKPVHLQLQLFLFDHNRVLTPTQSRRSVLHEQTASSSEVEDLAAVKSFGFWLHMSHKGPGRCEGTIQFTRTQRNTGGEENTPTHKDEHMFLAVKATF